MNAGAVFQGVSTANSYFEDSNQILIFEDLPVSGSLYSLRHVGNATGTNHFQLGTSTGSGASKEGANGGVIRAGGAAPFRIEAIDTNIDVAAYFGVTMLGPSALYADQLRNVKTLDSPSTFADITEAATGPELATAGLMPATEALDDATYFGHDEKFYGLNLNLSTAKAGTWTGTWEYYNGSSWASLTDITDGTSNYATTGAQSVTWAMPDDWATLAADGDTRYWIRFRISAFTSSGGGPTHSANGCTCDMAGDIRLEDPAAEIVGGSSTNMGSIRVRNGAFLKKHTINASLAPAKHGALDLGGANPATDTVREVVIQNCNKGVLLKGSGNVTYQIRGFTFSGNTNDFRVDFGGGDTVTIQILEGTTSDTAFTAGNQDNVNGSTITFVDNKSITLSPLVVGSTVSVYLAGTSTLVDETTNSTTSFNFTVGSGVGVDVVILEGTEDDPSASIPIRIPNVSFTVDQTVTINQLTEPNFIG